MNQQNENNKVIKIIVGAVILVGLVIFFSKDSIMYGYYVNKGDKEVESWKAVQDYTDALKIKYDDLLVDKIKLNVLQSDEYATSLLEDLDGVLKSSDLNQLYVDVYVKEATNAYKEGDYKLCEKELDKAVFYGYYKNDFNSNDSNILEILKYIERNYSSTNLKLTSEHFGYNMNYLSNKIKSSTGQTYKEIIEQRRLYAAQDLLYRTKLSLEDISMKIGYKNPSSLHRLFEKYINITPIDYRHQLISNNHINNS